MEWRSARRATALSVVGVALLLGALAAQASASGITGGGDDLRTGWYPNSSAITPQLVSGGTFGKLWSSPVEGSVYAQPLLDNGTLLVATEADKVYGLDPSTGSAKWEKSLGTPWNPSDISCADLTPTIGVTGTPVIDPATNVAYFTHKTYASGTSGPARWFMDAIEVSTGAERPGFPVELSGSAQNAPARSFSPTTELQRPGLLLMEGVVYAAFGAHCDRQPWQGWIFGVSTAGKVTARYVDNTTSEGAGIWQSGAGLTSDGPGTILFTTGNGGAPSKPAAGNSPPANLGESVVRVRVQSDGSLKAVDFFAPFNAPSLDEYDADFASGGVTGLPPQYFGTPGLPHLAVADGKQGYVYLLNLESLGGIAQGPGGSDKVIQRLGPRGGVWSRPGIWPGEGGYVYIPTSVGPEGGRLDVYKYGLSGEGTPSLSPAGSSSDVFGWGSGAPVITSEGTTTGTALVWIIWSADRTGKGGQLRAYDPVPVNGKPVLRFMAPIGTASNYSVPGVGPNRLYVGTREGKVLAFGSPVKQPLTGPALSFPTTKIGESSKKTLTLTANQNLTVSNLTSSSSQFTLGTPTPALPATLAEGAQISVPVTFAPTQTGLVGATVTATTDGGEQTQFAVSGTGQAEGADLEAAPPVISFQGTAIGGHRSEAVTFSNGGSQPLTIKDVELPEAPFSVEGAPKAGGTVAAGASITVTVKFDPTQAGTFNDTIGLQTTGGDAEVGISATAGAPGTLLIDSLTNDYGSVLLGASLTKSFTITNTGGTAVPINKSKPPIGGEFQPATELSEGTTIQAGETITERVAFAPTQLGPAVPGEWLITGEDTTGPHVVLFTGIGVNAPAASPSAQSSGGQQPVARSGISPFVQAAAVPQARLAGRRFKESKRGTVALRVSCPPAKVSCTGRVSLRVVTSALAGGSEHKAKTLTLASATFTVAGGRVRTVTLQLTARARALLARAGTLRVRATIASRAPGGVAHTTSRSVTLLAAGRSRH